MQDRRSAGTNNERLLSTAMETGVTMQQQQQQQQQQWRDRSNGKKHVTGHLAAAIRSAVDLHR